MHRDTLTFIADRTEGVDASVSLTPCGPLEGYQDKTNAVFVTGWAWNRETPERPVRVAVYDGDQLLDIVTADLYRQDLRDAGIGNGAHGFVCGLLPHIRDRKAHRITARIAGTNTALRDSGTDGLPRPVSYRDQPPPTLHYTMPARQLWFYFTLLHRILSVFPRPVWRPLAAFLACFHMVLDQPGRALNVALLRAMGERPTPLTRLRAHWTRAYQRQAYLVLCQQERHLTTQWGARHVLFDGQLPPGGAILLTVHETGQIFGLLALAARGYRLGSITARPHDDRRLLLFDATLQAHAELTIPIVRRALGDRWFSPAHGGRKGLHLLSEGGYLVVNADTMMRRGLCSPLLGKAMEVPRGPMWFAQRSGKPIIPMAIIPEKGHWRIWTGEPIASDITSVSIAIEECVRRAPWNWHRPVAMAWLDAPPAVRET